MTRRSQSTWWGRRGRPTGRPYTVLLAVLAIVPAAFADAPPAPPFEDVVPRAAGLVLDGKPDEEGWKTALAISAEPIGDVKPEVKVLVGGGCLWVSARVPEDPGFAMGLRWMICPDKTASAADCVALSYAPQDLRGPEFVARGPRGEGRKIYRFDGRADIKQDDLWTVETCLPIADLGLPGAEAPIRLAVVVTGRTPNRFSDAPRESAFRSPAAFAFLKPPAGGWGTDNYPNTYAEGLASDDAADQERLAAWTDYLAPQLPGEQPVAALARRIAACERAIGIRPNLALLHVALGNLTHDMHHLYWANQLAPHMRETVWAFARATVARQISMPPDFEPLQASDYEGTFKWNGLVDGHVVREAGLLGLLEGLLRFRRGDFQECSKILDPLAEKFAFDEEIVTTARKSKEWAQFAGQELALRKIDAARDDLPRVKITTSKGPVTLELFEQDAPNTVKNFVWLAEGHAYDGALFPGHERFRRVYFTEAPVSLAAWAIPTEVTKRKPFRGSIGMVNTGIDTAWARFFITTGTLPEVEGQVSVFGRVLEGQDVVDKLISTDTIEKIAVVRKRPGTEYRPMTVAGESAPEPKPK